MQNKEIIKKINILLAIDKAYFCQLTGQEQVIYIESLGKKKASEFITKNKKDIKLDAPQINIPLMVTVEIAEFFKERNHSIHSESKYNSMSIEYLLKNLKEDEFLYLKDENILHFPICDLNKIRGITSEIIFGKKAKSVSYHHFASLPFSEMDLRGCSFEGRCLSYADLSKTNINSTQLAECELLENVKLPKGLKYPEKLLVNKELDGIDFSDLVLCPKALCEAKTLENCKLPKGMDFSGCIFKSEKLSNINFSHSNITTEALEKVKTIHCCKFPKDMDFSGYIFKCEKLSNIDFSHSNITAKALENVKAIHYCKFPKDMNFDNAKFRTNALLGVNLMYCHIVEE